VTTTRQRILITGASSGLGNEMARQFAAMGRDLALCARRVERLEELRRELNATYPKVRIAIRRLDVDAHDTVSPVFHELAEELGGLDRVIVNAGLGKGAPIGTGMFYANAETATTNFVSALAQCEAGVEIFRAANAGHLVVISSMSAMRELPGALTTYAASKMAVAGLANGIRMDLWNTPIAVTTLYPGYIRSEMSDGAAGNTSLMASTDKGVRAMVKAIEREVPKSAVPGWPWKPLSLVMRYAPARVIRSFT
jgi:short-subunit dehydrogenase